jgi:hypothetical protein
MFHIIYRKNLLDIFLSGIGLLAYNLLIYTFDIKTLMNPIKWMILIGIILAFMITLPLTAMLMSAQAQIITLPGNENNTRLILNMDNLTQTLVNATTNETISVEKFTLYKPNATTNETLTTDTGNETPNETITTDTGNETPNETITTDTGNATTNETLTTDTGNATTNETLTTDTGNATTKINLTAKFNALQGK